MKKILALIMLVSTVACTNPEDSTNNNTDSAKNANTEGNTLNSPPGPTTKDSAARSGMDSSRNPTNPSENAGSTQH